MDSSTDEGIVAALDEGRRRFLALVDDVRPELHRYCARMTGSVADGEDVVQDTLARAYYQLPELSEVPPLRPWLFRIAHNLAIDHHRREAYRLTEPLDAADEVPADHAGEPDDALARRQAVSAALSSFLALAPAQRACVILKDVLDHSLDEIAVELQLSVPAVKAALHRGRVLLRHARPSADGAGEASPVLQRYASLFNAHDWDAVRALLADDVRLDLVSRRKASGRRAVGVYFANYERAHDWHLVPGRLDGREVLWVFAPAPAERPRYFIELHVSHGQVSALRDFRYVRYITADADFS